MMRIVMRTTVTFDADNHTAVRRLMRERGLTFEQAVNEALRRGLAPRSGTGSFRTTTYVMGESAVPTDKAMRLAAELEDEEINRKLALHAGRPRKMRNLTIIEQDDRLSGVPRLRLTLWPAPGRAPRLDGHIGGRGPEDMQRWGGRVARKGALTASVFNDRKIPSRRPCHSGLQLSAPVNPSSGPSPPSARGVGSQPHRRRLTAAHR